MVVILVVSGSTIPYLCFTLGFHCEITLKNTQNLKLKCRHIISKYTPLHRVDARIYSQLSIYTFPNWSDTIFS